MSQNTIFNAINNTGSTITAGSVVYLSGFNASLNISQIAAASCDNQATMPAIGVVSQAVLDGATTDVRSSGSSYGFNTFGVPINTAVYVGLAGSITFSDPNLINSSYITQQLGAVSVAALFPNGAISLFP